MSIQIGEKVPNVELKVMGEQGPESVHTDDLLAGKKVVFFAVPGAFTPGCSVTHLPGFVFQSDAIKAKGVDHVICTSVNDAFVMDAWGKNQNADGIIMLGDGVGILAGGVGLEKDLTEVQFGVRSQRYAMILDDGVVTYLGVDEKGVDKSSAETILAQL